MADAQWYEVPGEGTYPNAESAYDAARKAAGRSDSTVEVYSCTRTLVRTVQRNVTLTETDVTPQA